MKKILFAFSVSALAFAVTSCSSDPDFDSTEILNVADAQLPYDSDGVWADNLKSGFITIDDYEFSHIVDEYNLAYGFTASKIADVTPHNPIYEFPYAAAAGKGLQGVGSPYLVGYWGEYMEGENCEFDNRTCRIYDEDGDEFQPQSMMVCANTYLMYAVLDGTTISEKFEPGDWVTLVAHGVHLSGTESEATFYLVNIESDNVGAGIQTSWKEFDLTGLGTCTGIYFTMDCSERFKNEWGITIPTYFCMDKLIVKD